MFLKIAAAASLGLAAIAPANAAVTFEIDQSAANTYVNYSYNQLGWSNFSATLADLPTSLKTLEIGESWTFDFIDISIGGIGAGAVELAAQLSFLTPGGSAPGEASGWYAVAFFTAAGGLTWDGPTTITANGATYQVALENLGGLDFGHPITETVSATVTLIGQDVVSAPVPEPASWAMLIAGFGLVGGAMRLRAPRRVAIAA